MGIVFGIQILPCFGNQGDTFIFRPLVPSFSFCLLKFSSFTSHRASWESFHHSKTQKLVQKLDQLVDGRLHSVRKNSLV